MKFQIPKKEVEKVCVHPEHKPPMFLYLPPGTSHTHNCPSCGKETVMNAPMVTFSIINIIIIISSLMCFGIIM